MDVLVVLLLLASFGAGVMVHLWLVASLFLRRPRWRGLAALLLPPLAPFFGWQAGLRLRAGVWAGALVVYLSALFATGI